MRWPTARLADVAEIVSGSTPRTSEPRYWNGDIPWVTPADLTNLDRQYIDDTPRKLTAEGLERSGAKMLPVNAVLLSSRAPIGHVAVTRVPMATNQGFKSLIPRASVLDSKYLYWWLRANKEFLQGLGVGATFKEVSKAIVSRVEIPLPPLPEQRRIAAILDQADELRTKRRLAIDQVEDLLDALFMSMFGNPLISQSRWSRHTLGELGTTRLGKMLDAKQQSGEYLVPYLRNANVQWFRFDLDDIAVMDIPPEQRAQYRLLPGDVLICEGGQPGRSAVWSGNPTEMYFQKALHRYRPAPGLLEPNFLTRVLWLLSKEPTFGGLVTSATISHLTGEKLRALKIPVPPWEAQERFANLAASVEAVRAQHVVALAKLDELFASLQHRAFTGQL